jgi:hypothetical protein
VDRSATWTLQLVAALMLFSAAPVLFGCNPPAGSTDQTAKPAAPPPDAVAQPAPPSATGSDADLVKQRMRLCQQRPEICMQQSDGKAADAPHPPTESQVGK